MTTVTSSVRRSTRSPAPPSSSSAGNSNNGLTPEETAFQLLKQELEAEGWRDLSNKKCGLGFVFVKKGYSLDDAVDGESMVKEEGFTLNKYEELFFSTMDEEVIEDWNHKLPDHPKLPPKPVKKKKQVKNISPSDDDDSSEGEGGGGSDEECYAVIGSSRACASKKKGTAAAGKKRKAIKKKKKSSYTDEDYDFDTDGDDGVPGGDMRRLQRQIFDLVLDGRDKFDTFDKSRSTNSRPTSFKGFASESAKAMNNILLGTSDNAEMAKYKLMQMNPIYKKSVAEVDEYVAREAAALKKDLMEALLLDKFTLSDEEGEDENEDASGCGGAGVNNKEEDYEMVEKEEGAEKDDDDNKEVITEDDEMVDSSEGGGEVEDGKGSSDDDDNESS